MKRHLCLTLIFLIAITAFSHAQSSLNTELIDNIDYNVFVNDVWGYIDAQGNDYAVVGLRTGVAFAAISADKATSVTVFQRK